MKGPIRIVAPFRPFPAESELHKGLADFDWTEALRMLVHTAKVYGKTEDVQAITDVDTDLPVPALKYETKHRRLMLWTLEACLRYIESPDFDRNTVMLDVDQLVFGDFTRYFAKGADIGLLVRTDEKHTASDQGQPLLNGVQFWRAKSKKRLAEFYRRALEIAEQLPEDRIVWGADTDAVRQLIEPIEAGIVARSGLMVNMIEASDVIETFAERHAGAIAQGAVPWTGFGRPILDFRWNRKPNMPAAYNALTAFWGRA